MQFLGTSLTAMAVMICLCACAAAGDPPPLPPATAPESTQPATEPATQPARTPAELTLLDAGQEPRFKLQYNVKSGQKQAVNLTLRQFDAFQAMGEQRHRSDLTPPMVFRMETEVKSIESNGDIQYVFGFTEGTAHEERGVLELNLKGKRELAAMIVGVTGTATINNRGFTQEAGIVIPPTVNKVKTHVAAQLQNIRNLLEQNWLLLPEESVGVGAKWQVVSYSDANPSFAKIKQTAVYEVVSVDNNRVRVNVNTVESSGRQASRLVFGGASQTLISHKGKGTGTLTLDLTQLMPMTSTVTTDVETEFEYEIQGHREPFMTSATMQNQIETIRE
jgi:hypothetical protein